MCRPPALTSTSAAKFADGYVADQLLGAVAAYDPDRVSLPEPGWPIPLGPSGRECIKTSQVIVERARDNWRLAADCSVMGQNACPPALPPYWCNHENVRDSRPLDYSQNFECVAKRFKFWGCCAFKGQASIFGRAALPHEYSRLNRGVQIICGRAWSFGSLKIEMTLMLPTHRNSSKYFRAGVLVFFHVGFW